MDLAPPAATLPAPSSTGDLLAPDAEDKAYSHALLLNNPPENFDTPLPDGTIPRQQSAQFYQAYVEDRRSRGLELFPSHLAAARDTPEQEFKKAYSGLDTLNATLKPDQWKTLEAASKGEDDPQEFQARAINAEFLASRAGQEIPSDRLSEVRNAYAAQQLGITGPISDKQFYDAIKTRYAEDDATSKAISGKVIEVVDRLTSTYGKKQQVVNTNSTIDPLSQETRSVLEKSMPGFNKATLPTENLQLVDSYKPPTTQEREDFIKTLPERHQTAAREQWDDNIREVKRLFRISQPLVDILKWNVDDIKKEQDPEKAVWFQLDRLTRKLPENPRERGVVLAMLSNAISNDPSMQGNAMTRTIYGLARGINQAGSSIEQIFQAEVQQGLRLASGQHPTNVSLIPGDAIWSRTPVTETNAARGFSEADSDFTSRRRELLSVIQGAGMDLHKATDSYLQSSAIAAAPSAWMLPAAFTPIGDLAIQQTMAGDSLQNMRLKYPTISPDARTNAANISGGLQAVEEVLSDTTGAKIMMGKLPSFTGLLNKVNIQSPAGRALLGFAAGFAGTTGMEYTEEMTQGATDLAVSALAADLSGQKPDIQWGQYFKDWLTVAGPEQKETLLAVAAFGMVAGAGASLNHFKYGQALAQNKTFLKAHGFTDGEVRDITNTTNLDEASKKIEAAFVEAQRRGPTLTDEQKNLLAEERKAAIEILKARNEAAVKAGTPVITKETNHFTGDTEYIFNDPIAGTQSRHDSEDDAMLAWRDWSRTQDENALDTLQKAGHEDYITHLTDDGQAAQNVKTEISTAVQSLPKEQAQTEEALKAAQKDQSRAANNLQKRQAEERVTKAQKSLAALKARFEVMIFDEGYTPAQAADAFKNTVIRAKNFATEVMGRIAGYTVQLYGGHTVQDIAEDFAEVNMKQAIDQGFADPEIILDNIRRYEAASGAKVIDPTYVYDKENHLPILEGFSKLARGVVMSEVNSGLLPATVSKWIKTQIALHAASVELARDLHTAGEFQDALQAGYVPDRLHKQILDAVGLDPAAQQRRLERLHEEQLAAEAMQGFPEVTEEARGRLPHPETLRQNNHPLAGEVRSLWESLKKETRRRTKDGKPVDRTNEANAYFLPQGQMEDIDRVREHLNQRGFNFERPTDMLDALDASISYGKPFYGTHSIASESFSLGRSKIQTEANTQIIEGAEGSPSVIGPASFSFSAYHASPHKVDRFSTEKIGTGEGAQAYGWGLYFGSESVSGKGGFYDNKFSNVLRYDGQSINDNPNVSDDFSIAVELVNSYRGDPDAKKLAAQDAEGYDNPKAIRKEILKVDPSKIEQGANIYKVTLGVEENHLLDWDKPLSEQSDYVKNALKKVVGSNAEMTQFAANQERGTGGYFYGALAAQWNTEIDNGKSASKALAEAGIKGIRYLDGISRADGKGSSNYVVFDHNDISITDENGQPVSLAPTETAPTFAMSRMVAPTDYKETAHKVLATTNINSITKALLAPGEALVPLTEGSKLMVSPLYKAAKKGGNLEAAFRIAEKFTEGKSLDAYRELKGQQLVFVPVTQAEGERLNLIPITTAHNLADKLGGRVEETIIQHKIGGNTGATQNERASKTHEFTGELQVKPGEKIVLVDDTFTTGNTLTALYDHLSQQGIQPDYIATLASGRYTKDVAASPEKQKAVLDKTGVNAAEFERATGHPINAFTGAELQAYILNGAKGIDSFTKRFLGSSSESGASMVQGEIGSETRQSYALSTQGVSRLEQAIARKLTEGPDERAAFYDRLRDRLTATVQMLRDTKRNTSITLNEAEHERNRIQDALAEAHAVIQALPLEARGRVSFNPAEVMEATTERGQISALLRLIDRADDALENVLRKTYEEKFETLLDLAKPDLRQNKSIRGRLTPETQRLITKVLEAVTLDSSQHQAALVAKQAEIDNLEAADVPTDPEGQAAHQKAIVNAYIEQSILESFGDFSKRSASEMAHAYQQLESIYVRGRTIRKILDENRRGELKEATREVINSLPPVDQSKHAERTADAGFKDSLQAWNLGFSSFHQVMERLFPNSTIARDFQDRVRKADRRVTQARIEAKDRFDAFIFGTWDLSGMSRQRKANRILADLSVRRSNWNIELKEGVGYTTEKLTEEQAANILAGNMKVGWETDRIAMTSLSQALSDFRMQRLKAQNEERAFRKNVIQFQRITSRGMPGPLVCSDLEALYFLQLHAQEQYRPALDKYGFTADVMAKMEEKLNPKASDLGEFLRQEYDDEWNRLNPVFQRLYGLDMPKIRNYAPGVFEHMDAKSGDAPAMDSFGTQASVNSMSAGFTKARTHHMARPRLSNAMAAYWSHLEATEYFIHYAELSRDARQIFRNPEVRRRLEGNYGIKATRLFSDWLDALEVDGKFRATNMLALSEMTQKSLAVQASAGLAFNIGVLLKQIPAAMGFLLEMPTVDAMKGMVSVMAKPSMLKTVWNSEAVQQRILTGISPEDRNLLDSSKASPSLIMEMLEHGRLPIAYADAAFTTLSGGVAYAHHLEQARKSGLSDTAAEAHALAAATRVIERTAQPATTQDKSMAELTAKGFAKFLFMFKSDPRQKLAIVTNALQDVREGKDGAKSAAARKLLYGWVLYGLSNEVLADVWSAASRDSDDPDRWSWKDYLAAMICGPASSIPFVGQGFELAVRATLGTKAYINSSNPADKVLNLSKAKKVWNSIPNEDTVQNWNVNDWLTSAQQFSSSAATVGGVFDPRVAVVPAVLRGVRDAQGLAMNAYHLATPETPERKAMKIIQEIKSTAKPELETKAEERKKITKQILAMPADQRAQAINSLARTDRESALAVIRKIKFNQMTLSEQALSRLPKAERIAAIDKLASTMTPEQKTTFINRLQTIGIRE